MRVMLTENGMWGHNGPKAGDEGDAFYFSADEEGRMVFFIKFPGYEEYHACGAGAVTALITEVME